nr:unnamed protein product [Callosobruchus chinensis]
MTLIGVKWKEITQDKRILSWILGLRIPFLLKPNQSLQPTERHWSDSEKFDGILYEYNYCMPFGINCAPFVFTKLMKPPLAFLRGKGLPSVLYLDDFLLLGRTLEDCRDNFEKIMVRNRKRRTDRGTHSEASMREAVELVEGGMSLRTAAVLKNVKCTTLHRYVQKRKGAEAGVEIPMSPNYAVNKIFSNELEGALEEYLITCAKMCYGLDTVGTRRLAYDMAEFHKLKIPQAWEDRKMAGIDWLYGFRKRHPEIRLLALKFRRWKTRIFSLNETGTSTVQRPNKVFASKSSRQLNKVTSAERGTLVTTCCMVSATGSALPPAMVFPRKNFKNHMLTGAQPTGWMTGELFANPPCSSSLEYCKRQRITNYNISVFGPFQNFYNAAADSWMIRHPGETLSIYNVAELVGQAFDKAMTPSNIKSGFKKTGIFPFDRDVFTEDEFLVSEVTNRPLTVDDQQPSTSRAVLQAVENQIKSPLEFRDYPRAGPRKNTSKRKKGKSLILTDSPVKNEIEEHLDENNEYCINYMRHSEKIDNNFYFPLEPDMAMVSILDIELVLTRPNLIGKTKRQSMNCPYEKERQRLLRLFEEVNAEKPDDEADENTEDCVETREDSVLNKKMGMRMEKN